MIRRDQGSDGEIDWLLLQSTDKYREDGRCPARNKQESNLRRLLGRGEV